MQRSLIIRRSAVASSLDRRGRTTRARWLSDVPTYVCESRAAVRPRRADAPDAFVQREERMRPRVAAWRLHIETTERDRSDSHMPGIGRALHDLDRVAGEDREVR